MKSLSTRFYLIVSIGAIFLLTMLTTVAFAGGLILAPVFADNAQAAPIGPNADSSAALALPASQADQDILAAFENSFISLYNETVPSVVLIDVTQGTGQISSFEAIPDSPDGFGPQFGQGSGFVWDNEGHIVTNYHVVSGADEVRVTFVDGTQVEAEILGTDPDADLAVIKIDLPAAELQPVVLGDSDTLRVGELALAIGAPFGQEFTMTNGIISAVGRSIRSGNGPFSIPAAIQTDAPINPGNSGGPLFNRHGEVVGINSQIISRSGSSSGIGFAVPVNIAKRVVPTLIEGGDYEYAWLGISGNDVTAELANLLNLPAGTRGALIGSVIEDGPAEEAGLQGVVDIEIIDGENVPVGADIITAIDGQPITSINDVIVYLVDETEPGDTIVVDVLRADGQADSISVTLGTRPSN